MIAAVLVICGIAYNLLAIAGALKFRRRVAIPDYTPPVSILKPVAGADPEFYEAIRSHALQDYPSFEILFGAANADAALLRDIEKLRGEFPHLNIQLIDTRNQAPNGKVGSLEILAAHATHNTVLVNDGDILVPSDYLRRVIGLLKDESVGLVTCLYRGRAASLAARAEALGIATEFMPGVLVARLLSSSGFALGSTMAFRARELEAIGGFASIREYLADDYQLGARISALGKRVAMADVVVETSLGAGSWRSVWKHQLRWSRTIRVSRPAGYFGYIVTQATFWCVLAAMSGYPRIALVGLAARLAAAALTIPSLWLLPVVPLRDLFGFAVWCGGLFGNTVEWRGTNFHLDRGGRIRQC